MRVALACALALAACYAPELGPCQVHCAGDAPCPADMTCNADHFCHAASDHTDCSGMMFEVRIIKTGDGTGVVGGPGLSCGQSCRVMVAEGSTLDLNAMRDADSRFVGWSDACSGTAPSCTLVVDGSKRVTASFNRAATLVVTVTTNGGASGSVASDLPGIDCPANSCTQMFDVNTQLTLTANVGFGTFIGWGGACGGFSQTCTLLLASTGTTRVDAAFGP